MLKHKKRVRRGKSLPSKTVDVQLQLYKFPRVVGLEDISTELNSSPAEDLFGALLHAFALRAVSSEKIAKEGERVLEYLGRAFETELPPEVEDYTHILLMLLKEYDDSQQIRASEQMPPHELLRALLAEDGISQKKLVPDCFHTESQVSEFLHQKKGRDKLSYQQAVLLGNKFNVNPLKFLSY